MTHLSLTRVPPARHRHPFPHRPFERSGGRKEIRASGRRLGMGIHARVPSGGGRGGRPPIAPLSFGAEIFLSHSAPTVPTIETAAGYGTPPTFTFAFRGFARNPHAADKINLKRDRYTRSDHSRDHSTQSLLSQSIHDI